MPVARPSFVVIAGPNGSGKSTFTDKICELYRSARGENLVIFNPDREVGKLPPETENPNQYIQGILREQRQAAIANSTSFAYETVLSHHSHVDAMEAARSAGMQTWPFFVTTERPDINLQRVAIRVGAGGHDVPNNKVVERYLKSMALELPRAAVAADHGLLFDNSVTAHVVGRIRDRRLYLRNDTGFDWPEKYLADPSETFLRLNLLRS